MLSAAVSVRDVFDAFKGTLNFVFRSNAKLSAGFSIIFSLLLIAALAPVIAPYDASIVGLHALDRPPSFEHLLGTDTLGRDVFDQLIHGLRQSLIIGFFAGSAGLLVGITVGIISGYKGGWVDDLLRSVTDVFLVIPTIPLLVVLSSFVRYMTIPDMVLILAIFAWPFPARTFRAQVLSFRKREYINMARLSGLSDMKIVFKEVLPNMLPYVSTTLAIAISGAIMAEVFLELLGLGPQNTITLGIMVYWAMERAALIRGILWWVFPPMAVIVLIFIGLQLINIGLDEVFNPRLRREVTA